jgi:sigma-B regulation protein RsbU (phosphoserine phosphatase)
MQLLLKGAGYQSVTVDSPSALLRAAETDTFDVILADLNYTRDTTSGSEGLDLLGGLEARGISTPVIVMTAWGSIHLAVEAMRRGARDFIQKPWDNGHVLEAIRKQAEPEKRRKSELEIAAAVQQRLFPLSPRRLASLDYAGVCRSARGVGGDFYDFLDLGPDEAGFVLADISGKGMPAALMMSHLQASIRSQPVATLRNPEEALEAVNRHFHNSTAAEHFATLFLGAYTGGTRRLRYVNCGHCPPLLLRASGEVERLDPTATVLGAFANLNCAKAEVDLHRGDTLLLYSDGVTEAANRAGDEFGEEGLIEVLRESRALSAAALAKEVADAVTRFGGMPPADDVTVVAIRGV